MRAIYVLLVLSLALSGQALAQLTCTHCTVTLDGGTAVPSVNDDPVQILARPTATGIPAGTFTGTIVLTGNSEFTITETGHYTIDGVISSATGAATSLTLSASSAGGSGGQNAGIIFAGGTANTYTGTTTIKSGFIACKKSPDVVAIPGDITFKPGSATEPEAALWFGANNQLNQQINQSIGGGALLKFDRSDGGAAAAVVNLNGTRQTLLGIENAVGEKDMIGNVDPDNTTSILNVPKNTADKAALTLTGTGTTKYTFGNSAELRGGWFRNLDNGGLEIVVNGTSQKFEKPSNLKNLTLMTGNSGTLEVSATGASTEVSALGDRVFFGGTGIIKKTGSAVLTMKDNTILQSGGKIWVNEGVLRNNGTIYVIYASSTRNEAVLQVDGGATFDIYDTNSTFGGLTNGSTGGGTVENTSNGYRAIPEVNWNGYRTLTLNLNEGQTQTFSGSIRNNDTEYQLVSTTGTGKGGVNLRKEGNGTQILTGDNDYRGSTTVSSGTLKLAEGGKLQQVQQAGNYIGGLEIANVSAGTPAVFEHGGTVTQYFLGVISSSGNGTGTNLGTFRQSGTGKSIINGTNTFSGNVDITGGFLGGSGNLSQANGVTVGASGSIGGGLRTENLGGTLTVSNLTFAAAASKLIVTKKSDDSPSLVEVKTSGGTAGTVTAEHGFTVEIVGTAAIKSGYILKCSGDNIANRPVPTLSQGSSITGAQHVNFVWKSEGLWMQVTHGTITLTVSSVCPKGTNPGNPSITIKAVYTNLEDFPPYINDYFSLSTDAVKKNVNQRLVAGGKDDTITTEFDGVNTTSADLPYTVTYNDGRNASVQVQTQINRQPTVSVSQGGTNPTCVGAPLTLGAVATTNVVTFTSTTTGIAAVDAASGVVTTTAAGIASFYVSDKDGCKSEKLDVVVKGNPVVTSTLSTLCAAKDDGAANTTALLVTTTNTRSAAATWAIINPPTTTEASIDDGTADDDEATFQVTTSGATITVQKPFTVQYTNASGCKGTTVITVNPNPVVLSAPSTICASVNNAGATTALSATHDPTTTATAWVINPADDGVSVADGTAGDKLAAFSVVNTAIIAQKQATVEYTDNLGCKGRTTIAINPVPVITVSPATAKICSGEKTAISLSPNLSEAHRVTYSWTVSDNTVGAQSRPDNPAGFEQQTLTNPSKAEAGVTYTITPWYIPDGAAPRCPGLSGTSVYTVVPRGEASISNTTPEKVCLSDQITLEAAPKGAAYQWLKDGAPIQGAASDSFLVPTANIETFSYAVNVTSSGSACVTTSNSRRVEVTEDAYFIGAGPKMDKMETELNRPVSFTYTGPDAVYSWDFGDMTAVVTTQNASHSYSALGTYKPTLSVVKPNQVVCKKTFTLPDLKISSITGDLEGSTAFSVYPVPAQDRLTIVSDSGDLQNITIRDISGKTVMSEAVNGSKATVSVARLTNGIYLLTITGSKGVKHIKISKN